MQKLFATAAVLVACALCAPATSAASPPVDRLQLKTKRLRGQLKQARQLLRSERRANRRLRSALAGGVSAQVAQYSRIAPIKDLKAVVLDPLLSAWPCESNHSEYFGSYIWSVSLELEVSALDEDCPWASG